MGTLKKLLDFLGEMGDNDYINNEGRNKMNAWIGTVCGIIGAMLVAANNGFQDIGYVFFLIGSVFSLYAAIKENHKANITLWLVFASINVFGLSRYF